MPVAAGVTTDGGDQTIDVTGLLPTHPISPETLETSDCDGEIRIHLRQPAGFPRDGLQDRRWGFSNAHGRTVSAGQATASSGIG